MPRHGNVDIRYIKFGKINGHKINKVYNILLCNAVDQVADGTACDKKQTDAHPCKPLLCREREILPDYHKDYHTGQKYQESLSACKGAESGAGVFQIAEF